MASSDERALIIKAKGGLGNRMLAAVTGCVLATLNNRTPYIDWRDGMYVPPGQNLYPSLFDASWMGELTDFDATQEAAPAIWSGCVNKHPFDIITEHFPKQHRDPLLYRKLSIDLVKPDPAPDVAVFWSYLPKLKRLAARMAKHSAFKGRGQDEITSEFLDRYFKPVPEVAQAVDSIFAKVSGAVIGVHIRFTDRKAPLPKIIRKLEGLASANPDAAIFLATDSGEAQDAIQSRFPNVITIDKAIARDGAALHFSSDGFDDPVAEARNALIDMMALARCNWLLHSSHSTFSVTAALIGRIAKERQIDVDRFNLKVQLKSFVQART